MHANQNSVSKFVRYINNFRSQCPFHDIKCNSNQQIDKK